MVVEEDESSDAVGMCLCVAEGDGAAVGMAEEGGESVEAEVLAQVVEVGGEVGHAGHLGGGWWTRRVVCSSWVEEEKRVVVVVVGEGGEPVLQVS